MSASSSDFMCQAERLSKDESEIDHRSAISRAYYAAYHDACGAAQRLALGTVKKDGAGVHEQLIARYETGGKRLKIIGNKLRSIKRMRAVADYHLNEDVTRAEAESFVSDIKRLLAELDRLSPCRQAR